MIPWDNVTISARARITQANKRLRSLTAGGGRHGMAISRGLVVQNDAESGELGVGVVLPDLSESDDGGADAQAASLKCNETLSAAE